MCLKPSTSSRHGHQPQRIASHLILPHRTASCYRIAPHRTAPHRLRPHTPLPVHVPSGSPSFIHVNFPHAKSGFHLPFGLPASLSLAEPHQSPLDRSSFVAARSCCSFPSVTHWHWTLERPRTRPTKQTSSDCIPLPRQGRPKTSAQPSSLLILRPNSLITSLQLQHGRGASRTSRFQTTATLVCWLCRPTTISFRVASLLGTYTVAIVGCTPI